MRRSHPELESFVVESHHDIASCRRIAAARATASVDCDDNDRAAIAPDSLPLATRFARAVSGRRRELGFTQAQLAEALGVETETISRFERGKHLPSLKKLEKLASLLAVPVAALLAETVPEVEDEAQRISVWLRRVSENDRKFILELVKRQSEHLSQCSCYHR